MNALQRVVLVLTVLATLACGSEESDPKNGAKACVPGESQACTGPAGCQGGQVCNADGTGFGTCDCGTGGTGGGSGGGAGATGDSGGATFCPTGFAGPELVEVSAPDATKYCIDSTEVTFAHFNAFQAAKVDPATQEGNCTTNFFNIGGGPSPSCPLGIEDSHPGDHPVICVDWCDAVAYCKWAGKRLCGRIGSGPSDYDNMADPAVSQWFNACSAGGTLQYAYGEHDFACASTPAGVVGVKTLTKCAGPLPGLFGMSSNAGEWEDACDTGGFTCRIRGGSEGDYPCDTSSAGFTGSTGVGFRCCHDGNGER